MVINTHIFIFLNLSLFQEKILLKQLLMLKQK